MALFVAITGDQYCSFGGASLAFHTMFWPFSDHEKPALFMPRGPVTLSKTKKSYRSAKIFHRKVVVLFDDLFVFQ